MKPGIEMYRRWIFFVLSLLVCGALLGSSCPGRSVGSLSRNKRSAQVDSSNLSSVALDPDPWVQTNGPPGGLMDTIEMHPDIPTTLFAGGFGGVFKSTDGGVSWRLLPPFISPNRRVYKLIIDSTNPQIMYAFTGQLHKTPDGGETWTTLDGGRWFTCVTINPDNPLQLLAGDQDGHAYLSTNGGETWVDSITSNLPGLPISALAFGEVNVFWAGTQADTITGLGKLYHTTNRGGIWNVVNLSQSPDTDIYSIFVDPQDHDIVHVGLRNIYNTMFNPSSDSYLFRISNSGLSWDTLHLPWTDSMIDIIGKAPTGGWLYIDTGHSLYKSSNGMTNWIAIQPDNNGADGSRDIAVHPTNSNILYLPSPFRGGVYSSSDGGGSWVKRTQGMLNTNVSLIALGNPTGSTLYGASVSGEGTFKTSDYGNNWVNVTEGGIDHPWADELVVSPIDPQTLWEVADVGKFFISEDGGANWSKVIDPQNGYGFRAGTVTAMAVAPSEPEVIYSLKGGFGIFSSQDGGVNWDFLHHSEVDYSYSLAVHPSDPDVVYSGYSPKPFQDWAMVRRTQDGGENWTTVLSVTHSAGITSVAIDTQNPDRIYAGSTGLSTSGGGRIYRSESGGDTWDALNPHFTMLTVWGQPQLIGDPSNPSTVYAATWLAGTWKSTDAGSTWTKLSQAPVSSTSLSIDPTSPNVIYSADRTAPKVWRSTDGGATWTLTGDFSADRAFLVNRVLVAGGAVFASTFGPGIHGGRLYRSMNGGADWDDITNGLPRSVLDIAVNPFNSEKIYVTTHIYGAYRSTNGGANWDQMDNFPDIGGYDIEIDPLVPETLFAAGMGAVTVPDWVLPEGHTFEDPSGVYRSQDGGDTWENVLATSNECRAVRFYPGKNNLLFAAALSDGFFMSDNGGNTWTNSPLDGLDTHNLTSVWAASDKIYVGTQGFGIYAGDLDPYIPSVAWIANRSNKPVPDVYSLQIQVDPANSSRIYVGANPGGLFRSDDGGDTWFDKNFLTPSVVVDDPKRQGYYTFAINPDDTEEVWLGTWGKGVYKSYDGQDFNIGAHGNSGEMFGKHINALLFHPNLGLLAASEEGVFQTEDGGNTWVDFSDGLGTTQVRTLAVDTNGKLYAGTAGYELYYRQPEDTEWTQFRAFSNFGTFWPIWNNRPLYQYSTILFHPIDVKTIYFGTFPAGIFKSLDGGETWSESNVGWLNDGVFSLVFKPGDTNTIYVGTYNGVSRSVDAGLHWERWDKGWPGEHWVFSIAFDPLDPKVMYACSKNGENEGTGQPGFHGVVMKSLDGGENWFEITTGLDKDNEFYKIIVDKLDHDTLYLATQLEGVFISYDGGAHWLPWNEGLTNLNSGTNGNNVTNTMALSDNGEFLYFGTAGSGVFRRMPLLHIYLPLIWR